MKLMALLGVLLTLPAPVDAPPRTASLLYFQDAHDVAPVLQDDGWRGGVARVRTVLDRQRAEHPHSAAVFGGDLAGGTLFGGIYRGFPMVEAFNRMDVRLAGFGQHDFDFGAENTRDLVAAADFPWVSSNIVDNAGRPFLPHAQTRVQHLGQVRIGYLGLTGDMANTVTAGTLTDVDPVPAAQEAVRRLREQDVDVIIAVTQISREANQRLLDNVPEISAALREEDDYDTPSEITVREDGRLLLAPEGNMGTVLRLDISVDGDEVRLGTEVLDVDERIAPDPELKQFEDFYAADLERRLGEHLGTTTAHLDRENTRYLAADAFRAWGRSDLGWMNLGGARADIPGPDVTLRDAYSVLPFGNQVSVIEVTGAELAAGIERSEGGDQARPSGFRFRYTPAAPAGARISELRLENGEPVDPRATYTLAITTFAAQRAFPGARVRTPAGIVDAEALAELIRARGLLSPVEPRVVIG
ncbi:bifunctional UDP-sugar hydrolase/5'-nucleotidase [Saccharopolyspora taberi]|uniref:5'-nucleotidase C-terminal domain-containing protein n=1 Tax=Saccharopolyspora taberi TaxID=60895 RepID=A0ABN3VNK8_9PSEU